jgi:hypothetical protein
MKTPKFLIAIAFVSIFVVALFVANNSSFNNDQTVAVEKAQIRVPPMG